MTTLKRAILVVLDGVGAGANPDAHAYGDDGASSLEHCAQAIGGLALPHLGSIGLGNITPIEGTPPTDQARGAYGLMTEAAAGKDSISGHWEMTGVVLQKPLPTYPHGFSADLVQAFERAIGRKAIGNKVASGTEIIKELGEEHMRTGKPIIYTSADSVFQVAAHEEVIPLWELYKICETAREMLRGPYEVGRVIARPFIGSPGQFTRTPNRHDYAVPPPKGMLLDQLEAAGIRIFSVGKIFDVFLGRGIQDHEKTKNNTDGMAKTLSALDELDRGLIFVNLVDLDQLYGHRNDVEGYARALEEFDAWLPSLYGKLSTGDLLILTADHGCDPTTPSTDHSREYVPLLAYRPRNKEGVDLGLRSTLSDIGQTVAENFDSKITEGASFLQAIA